MQTKALFIALALFMAAGTGQDREALGATPQAALEGPINEIVALLTDPRYADGNQAEEQRDKMWAVAHQIFDFREISRRVLAANWKRFDTQQRSDFTDAFTQLLGSTYFDKIQSEFHNEEVVFLNEELISDTKARVKTKIVRESVEIPVDYSMRRRDAAWRIYDVRVEGVSLVSNYRSQFRRILMKSSPDDLIAQVRQKVASNP
jgi:phospholipid transport system substrate-binding protein